MMARRKLNLTPIGAYFHEKREDFQSFIQPPGWYVPRYREPLPALCWHIDRIKANWTASAMAQTLNRATMPHTLFFIDTNFFSRPIDEVVWRALAERDLVITPFVRRELQPWLDNGTSNPFMRERLKLAIKSGDAHIHFDEVDEVQKSHGFSYYTRLLGLRKVEGKAISLMLAKKLGREPTDDEFFRASRPTLGDRGQRIARKGWKEWGRPNFLADEQLVVMAVQSALLSGNYVVILTRDHDIAEQFYKLIYLIDTHYRGMLLAEMISRNPEAHKKVYLRDLKGYVRQHFVGEDDYLVASMLPNSWDDLPSYDLRTITIECWWFGDGPKCLKFSQANFCAKMEMGRLLEIKGRTDGLNTDLLSGKTCHICPFPGSSQFRGWGAVVEDKRNHIKLLGADIIGLDGELALLSQEGHVRIRSNIHGEDQA